MQIVWTAAALRDLAAILSSAGHPTWSLTGFAAKRSRSFGFCTHGSAGPIDCELMGGRADNPLEFAPRRCYICAMMANGGWMLRITGPILG